MSDGMPGVADADRRHTGAVMPDWESGTYESDADTDHVWVRRDSTGKAVKARYAGYPALFTFEPGDETGLEQVDGAWQTIPSVAHTVQLASRIEWWTRNRRTGLFRLLVSKDLQDPAHPARAASNEQGALG